MAGTTAVPGVPRARRTARRLIALGLLLVPVLTACSGADGAGSSSVAVAADTAGSTLASGPDCLAPQVLTALGFDAARVSVTTSHPDAPEAGPLPETFTPVSAVLCSTGETLSDAAGRWAAVTASRLEGDIAPLVDALRSTPGATGAATTAPVPSATPSCPDGATRADLWLVDALGAAVRVTLPGGSCDGLTAAVRTGLAALDEVDVESYPVELVEPHASPTP
jgi:hypothetical protein